MHLRAVGLTDKGIVRSENQDSFLVQILPCSSNKNSLLAIVADGVGGENAGNIASMTAVEVIKTFDLDDDENLNDTLKKAIEAANSEIYGLSCRNADYKGMATTCSTLMIKGDKAIIAHVGDSRVYRIKDGIIEALTEDHTLPVKLYKSGYISDSELEGHPQSNVLTNALGSKNKVEIDIITTSLMENDTYVLCSDGLYKYLTSEEINEIVTNASLDSSAEKLIALANSRGGDDNITVVVVKAGHNNVSNKTVRIDGDEFSTEVVQKVSTGSRTFIRLLLVLLFFMVVIVFISFNFNWL